MTDYSAEHINRLTRQVISAWKANNKALGNFMEKFADEVYLNRVAPGRNRAVYIVGHLVSASDDIFPLFGLGERLYPNLPEIFSTSPDGAHDDIPVISELRNQWQVINEKLANAFEGFSEEAWMSGHTRVSADDFAADPSRNKLNVLMARNNHISYHLGQLNLLFS